MKLFILVLITVCINLSQIDAKSNFNQILQDYGAEELQKSLKDFIKKESSEQKEIFHKCHKAAKEVWKNCDDKAIKAKILATTLKTIELYNQGYPVEEAAQLAKLAVEMTAIELEGLLE